MNSIIKGAYDLHIHTAPDVVKRKCDDIQLAERLEKYEMAGCIIKNHYTDTSTRAILLQKQFPNLEIAGGVVLNNSVGGLNSYAVEKCAEFGGKILWFPTMDSYEFQKCKAKDKMDTNLLKYISLCDENGKLKKSVYEILEIAAAKNMLVGTGHISAVEGLKLVKEAKKIGAKVILTHADNPANCYSKEEQKEAVNLGAIIEHSYFTVYYNRTTIQEIAEQIRYVGYENVYISTDFGQLDSLYSDEGMEEFALKLMKENFSLEEIRHMICELPKYLMRYKK